ncbi:MAG TPA: hypothetical protein PK992_08890, partial [Planctomycetaceae bacterium]|nr:hypothetical protein [Planctomycetaceae bacterium]
MLVVAGHIVFWFSTIVMLLGTFLKNVAVLRRVLRWQFPSSVTDHSGAALSPDCRFFAIPSTDEHLLYSAEVTIRQPDTLLRTFFLACIGAVVGLAWGIFGVWLSSIEPGVLQYFFLGICTAMLALEFARHWTPACMTYVCADRFGF